MNDEQIKDSLRNLAATAPRTDIWPRISGQVESQPPRPVFWTHLRLRPVLVGLNVVAIAALLFITIGPLGLVNPPAQRPGPNSGIANPTTQPAGLSPTQANTEPFYPVPLTYTLVKFAQIMAYEPNFRLPTALPSGYKLSEISVSMVSRVISGTSTVTLTEELSRYGWYVEYQKNTPGQDQQIIRLHVSSHVGIVRAGDTLRRSVTLPNPLDAVGNPSYEIFGGYTSDSDRLTARYRRADRIIELYHDVRLDRSQNRYAFVYFANQDAQHSLTQFSIYAPENVSDAELLKMADSIERVDPNHLERYQ